MKLIFAQDDMQSDLGLFCRNMVEYSGMCFVRALLGSLIGALHLMIRASADYAYIQYIHVSA